MAEPVEPAQIRVTLREFADSDADDLFEWMRDPVSVRMAAFTSRDPDDREAFDAWLARIRANPAVLHRSIDEGGAFAGMVATFAIDGHRELTYWVDRARWGRGIASRAVAAILALDPTRPISARAASANPGSLAVLRRAGFVETGRDVGFAQGVGVEVEETLFRLD